MRQRPPRRYPFHLFAPLAAVLVVCAPGFADDASVKSYECEEGFKIDVFPPKDGVMQARADDLNLEVSVRDGRRARYDISLVGIVQTSSNMPDDILPAACSLVSGYYEDQKAPSGEDLRKDLSAVYEAL